MVIVHGHPSPSFNKCIGTAVIMLFHLLNKAKSPLFQSIMNFKTFEDMWISSHSQPASKPTVKPGCNRCRALKITQTTGYIYCVRFTKLLFQRHSIFLLRHGVSFVLTLLSFLLIGMHKQFA